MTRDEWKEAEAALCRPDVRTAMRARCEEQGHEWENGCDMFLRVFMICKWCGEKR